MGTPPSPPPGSPPPPPGSPPPPPGSPPPPPGPVPPPSPRRTGLVVALAFAGAFGYWIINVVVGVVVLNLESSVWLGIGAALLALGALGGGIALVLLRRPWTRGLGLGLMIGWALASIVSAGYCTGLNPGLYA